MAGRARPSDPEVLPAITVEVEPTERGVAAMESELDAFAREHHLSAPVRERLVMAAGEVAAILVRACDGPPVRRLQADADIGVTDAQFVMIAADDRLPAVYAALRPRLAGPAVRCDGFSHELTPSPELHVWGCFRLGEDA
jgi:hypothetical protein